MTHDLAAISRQHHFAGQSVAARESLGERLPECSMANHCAAAQKRPD